MTDRNPDHHCPVCGKYVCSSYATDPVDKWPTKRRLAEKCSKDCLKAYTSGEPKQPVKRTKRRAA